MPAGNLENALFPMFLEGFPGRAPETHGIKFVAFLEIASGRRLSKNKSHLRVLKEGSEFKEIPGNKPLPPEGAEDLPRICKGFLSVV